MYITSFIMYITSFVYNNMYMYRYIMFMFMNNLSRDAERQGNNNTTERQSNTTQLARNSNFSKKNWLPQVGLEPTTISSPGDALTHHIRNHSWIIHCTCKHNRENACTYVCTCIGSYNYKRYMYLTRAAKSLLPTSFANRETSAKGTETLVFFNRWIIIFATSLSGRVLSSTWCKRKHIIKVYVELSSNTISHLSHSPLPQYLHLPLNWRNF